MSEELKEIVDATDDILEDLTGMVEELRMWVAKGDVMAATASMPTLTKKMKDLKASLKVLEKVGCGY